MKFRTYFVFLGKLPRRETRHIFFSLRGSGNPLQITEHVLVQRAYSCVVSDGSEYRCCFVSIRTGFVR